MSPFGWTLVIAGEVCAFLKAPRLAGKLMNAAAGGQTVVVPLTTPMPVPARVHVPMIPTSYPPLPPEEFRMPGGRTQLAPAFGREVELDPEVFARRSVTTRQLTPEVPPPAPTSSMSLLAEVRPALFDELRAEQGAEFHGTGTTSTKIVLPRRDRRS